MSSLVVQHKACSIKRKVYFFYNQTIKRKNVINKKLTSMFWVVVVKHNYCLGNDYVFEKLLFLQNVLLIKNKSMFSKWPSVWKVNFFTINRND